MRDIYLSTFSTDAIRIIRENGIGIEFNQFCISRSLDEAVIDRTLAAMEKDALDCGLTLPGAKERMEEAQTQWEGMQSDYLPEQYGNTEVDDFLAFLSVDRGVPAGGVIDPEKSIVHGPFTEIIPGAIDTAAVDYMMGRVEQAAAGTLRLGLRRMVLHTGYYPTIYYPQWHVQQSVKFWERFMADKPEDFRLYLENVFDPEPDTLIEILDTLGDPRVKACLDVGHASAVRTDPLEWIRALGPRIGHFHMHNNDGKTDLHDPLTEGVIDMGQVLQAIDNYCPPEATLTIESRECEESVVWLVQQTGGRE